VVELHEERGPKIRFYEDLRMIAEQMTLLNKNLEQVNKTLQGIRDKTGKQFV